MQNNVNLLFPASYKSTVSSALSNSVSSSKNNDIGKTFADTLKGVTDSAPNTPPIRSAKATERYEWLMQEAKADPDKASDLANLYAYDSLDGPLLDTTDLPIVRLSTTGEIYTPQMRLYYSQVRNAMQGERSALYESELAKGTPAVQILDKLLAYNDSLPAEFRRIADW